MAVIKCRECGNEVSDQAATCPHCGIDKPAPSQYGLGSLVLIGLVVWGVWSIWPETDPAELRDDEVARLQEQARTRFKAERDIIIAQAQKQNDDGEYAAAIDTTQPFEFIGDPELNSVLLAARDGLRKLNNAMETERLLADVKVVPASDAFTNVNMYKRLAELNPEVALYREKVSFYEGKLEEQRQREMAARQEREAREQAEQQKQMAIRAERVDKFGEAPTASPWDGSYYEVEKYLKRVANDPDSIEIDGCTKVFYTNEGWAVACDYRGRNAFGGMVRNTNWFNISHGRVTQMHDADKYQIR